jgi:alpha-N-acetylglucosaminidase
MKHLTFILVLVFSLMGTLKAKSPTHNFPAAQAMIHRLLPAFADAFVLDSIPVEKGMDVFEISMEQGKIKLAGSSIPAIGSALNYYLKNYCHCQLSRAGVNLNMPEKLPIVKKKVHIASPYKYRYYLNYCTFNYSMSWWTWRDWEHELDWMALHGINLSLAIVGHEKVWQETLRKFNFTEEEINQFIPGPAYTAWWLMGNLEGWGGQVDQDWIDRRVELQKKILGRMKELGINPVLQNFYGYVPDALRKKYPNNDIRYGGIWAGKHGFQRPATLVPTDSLFKKMAKVYYNEQKKLYGDWLFYGGDPFHEGGVKEGIDITASGKAIHDALLEAYPKSTWVLQGWWENPTKELLAGAHKDKVLILDLFCESQPQWKARNQYDGRQWIWCGLLNFGSKVGMYGKLDTCAIEPIRALKSSKEKNLVGIGTIIEGNETNPVNFDLVYDIAWRTESPEMTNWLHDYTYYRYGKKLPNAQKAWDILLKTVYNCDTNQCGTSESFICARPKLIITSAFEYGQTRIYYDPQKLEIAGKLLLSCSNEVGNNDAYLYDLVDVTRQILSNRTQLMHKEMVKAFQSKNKTLFELKAKALLDIMFEEDTLLATRKEFLLGNWLEKAKALGNTAAQKDMLERNARNLITVWGDKGVAEELHDYSCREWSGMIRDFYIPRWQVFINDLRGQLNGDQPRQTDWYQMELSWVNKRNSFSDKPTGNSLEIARRLLNKYVRK